MDYFATAVSLARQEGAKTLAQVAMKSLALKSAKNRKQETCYCSEYAFPHRAGSGACPGLDVEHGGICSACNGSGEGMHDGSICGYCNGMGEI